MATSPIIAADALVKAADKAGERTAQSAMDSVYQDFELPTDPSSLGKMYGKASTDLSEGLDLQGALDRSKSLGTDAAVAGAASMFENKNKREELAKTPVTELDQEINRLTEQKWGILPAVLGRTDILDYGTKMKIATRAEQMVESEIQKLGQTRQSIVTAAENRAKDKTDQLKATATLLDKQAEAAKNDLTQRINLFKAGNGTFDDIVQAALELRKINDARNKAAAGGNSLIGMGQGGQFSPGEIAAFGYFEKFGDFPVAVSSSQQQKLALTQRYAAWAQAGRPGSSIQIGPGDQPLPAGTAGPTRPPQTADISSLFATPAAARASGLAALFGSAPQAASTPGEPLPTDDEEFGRPQ